MSANHFCRLGPTEEHRGAGACVFAASRRARPHEAHAGPSARKVRFAADFRIGIHLGDVVEESDGDLMGDGINIAARRCAGRDLSFRGRLSTG
jgi:class 3 adenylate cyclase